MKKKIIVNQKQVERIAESLSPLQICDNHNKRPFLVFEASKETKLRAYLFASAICHQTHSLIDIRKNLKGWSVIENVFTNLGTANSKIIDPKYLNNLTPFKLGNQLRVVFSGDDDLKNCTLNRIVERSKIMIQISRVLVDKYESSISNVIELSRGYVSESKGGLYRLLQDFNAFLDPQKKKSTLFVQLLTNAGLFIIKDPESIEPMVDYHMQRLLLRTGCVEVINTELEVALKNRMQIKSDVEVRVASIEALRLMRKLTGKSYFDLGSMLWSLSRSCCRKNILCASGRCDKYPCTFFSTVNISNHNQCVFDGVCVGNKDKTYRDFWEPNVSTSYY